MRPLPALLLAISFALPLLAGCCVPFTNCCKPDTCPQAQDGRARLQPVVEAVVAYRTAEGAYPDSVAALIPAYLPALPARPAWVSPERAAWWSYARTADGFTVEFTYYGPGSNWCRWASDAGAWRCGGHF
ncbi:MAG TPA: hypothetical protein VK002_09490 [Rubricoccaceae bacterium]|jgi:hypothetical protein|nr:hypothetical protein [Rubricoccaceae bacterium]